MYTKRDPGEAPGACFSTFSSLPGGQQGHDHTTSNLSIGRHALVPDGNCERAAIGRGVSGAEISQFAVFWRTWDGKNHAPCHAARYTTGAAARPWLAPSALRRLDDELRLPDRCAMAINTCFLLALSVGYPATF